MLNPEEPEIEVDVESQPSTSRIFSGFTTDVRSGRDFVRRDVCLDAGSYMDDIGSERSVSPV
jgi:hypothetical protein